MKELGHGAGYRYAHDEPGAYVARRALSARRDAGSAILPAGSRGLEIKMRARLRAGRRRRAPALRGALRRLHRRDCAGRPPPAAGTAWRPVAASGTSM